MNWRRMLFEIVEPDKGSSVASRIFDWLITSLILLSVVIVFAGTFDFPQRTLNALSAVECIASIVFTVEYGIRILTADFLYPERGAIRSRLRTDGDSPRQTLVKWAFRGVPKLSLFAPFKLSCVRAGRFTKQNRSHIFPQESLVFA